jgi:PAS domain S-box-containing protein
VQSGFAALKHAFDHAPVGMSLVRASDSSRMRVNRFFCDFLGYSEAELMSLPPAAIVPPQEHEQDVRDLQELIEGGVQNIRRVRRYVHKTGKLLWGDFSGTLIRREDGTPDFFLSLVQDITQRVEEIG